MEILKNINWNIEVELCTESVFDTVEETGNFELTHFVYFEFNGHKCTAEVEIIVSGSIYEETEGVNTFYKELQLDDVSIELGDIYDNESEQLKFSAKQQISIENQLINEFKLLF